MKQQDLFGGSPLPPAEPARPVRSGAEGPTPRAAPVEPVEALERPEPSEPPWVRSGPVEAQAAVATPAPGAVPAWRTEAPKKVEQKILSVGELTRAIKETIEPVFSRVLVRGEVSGFRGPNVRGHLYFALKDDTSAIDVKVWQSTAARIKFGLKDGLQVIVEGSVDLYEPSGRYSLIVQRIEPSGVGALALAFEQLKAKLLAEGLFGPNRKRPKRALPMLPKRIGVVTSITGAALRDFLKVLHRRHPRLAVLVADARVQGDGAALEISRGIRRLGRQGVDVIVVTRGGGSAEDLRAFNEELVARAIFESPVPVVSAVGHEVDTTLADYVADFRAPTPSAAAEALAPVLADLQLHLANQRARLRKAVERRIIDRHRELGHLEANLGDPRRDLSQRRLHLSETTERMRAAVERTTRARRGSLQALNLALQKLRPQAQLLATRKALHQLAARLQSAASLSFRREREGLTHWRERLHNVSPKPLAYAARDALKTVKARLPILVRAGLLRETTRLKALELRLQGLNPEKVLTRGYAIALKGDGRAVRAFSDVKQGESLTLRLGRGEVDVTVTGSRQTSYTAGRDDDKTGEG